MTDHKSSKKPTWNKGVTLNFPSNQNTFVLEVFDQVSLKKTDKKIAWATVSVPNAVYAGTALTKYVPLHGKHGPEGKVRFQNIKVHQHIKIENCGGLNTRV